MSCRSALIAGLTVFFLSGCGSAVCKNPFGSSSGHHCVSNVRFSPDGSWILIGQSKNLLKLWNVRAVRIEKTIETQAYYPGAVISPDGTMLAAIGDSEMKVWNMSDWSVRYARRCETGDVEVLAFSPDSSFWLPEGATAGSEYGTAPTGRFCMRCPGTPIPFSIARSALMENAS